MKRFFLFTMMLTFGFFANVSTVFGQHFVGQCGEYSGNLTLGAIVQMTGSYELGTHVEIAPFCGTQCRGDGVSLSQNGSNWEAIMTICGDPGDEMTFKLFDANLNEEFPATCNTTFTYTMDDDVQFDVPISFTAPPLITTIAEPTTAATISGGGYKALGSTATLSFVANPGYSFLMWTDATDHAVGTEPTYSFTVTDDATYKAKFSAEVYMIYATAHPSAGGTVAVAGATEGTNGFHIGDECTLTATANTDYGFINWKNDADEVVSTEPSFTFTVDEYSAGTYHAYFGSSCTITVVADPTEGGTVTGGGTYAIGTTVNLEATPAEGYSFVMWTDEEDHFVSGNNPYALVVNGSGTYKAKFASEIYTIYATAHPSVGGTVTVAGATEGTNGFHYGDVCTLTATPAADYEFVNWKNDADEVVSTALSFNFTVNEFSAGTYHAYFNNGATYTITATCNPEGAGTIEGADVYPAGATCTLVATPADANYSFVCWTKGGEIVSSTASYSFTVTEDAEYVANFSVESYLITATVTPSGSGTVTGAGLYAYHDDCTLEATANEGYVFVNWTKDDVVLSTSATYTFTVEEAGDYVAHFAASGTTYTVTVTCDPEGAGEITGAGNYVAGSTVTLQATANDGYSFLFWMIGSDMFGDNPYSFTINSDVDVVAYFSSETYIITVAANPAEGGTVTGGGGYTYGQTATLTATANEGYVFNNWTLNGSAVSEDAIYSFTVTESGDYVANFAEGCVITTTSNPEGAGVLTGAGTYAIGATVTLTATPANPGSEFLFWTLNEEIVSENANYTFTATESAEYVANFSVENYIITATANPADGGTVTGGGSFTYGQNCTLTATANEGYVFSNWTLNGTEVATTPEYTFAVTESGDYVANFVMGYSITAECEPAAAGVITGTGAYAAGQTCTLGVVPTNSSFTFVFWTKNGEIVSYDEVFSFTVTESAHYVANFTYETYIINAIANPNAAGTVTGGGAFMWGESCTLTATANVGYSFVNWTVDGVEVSTEATYTFTVTESGLYTANFSASPTNTITAIANPEDGGELTGAGVYNTGSTCTLSATANDGYEFVNWTLNGEVVSTDASFSFTVTEDATYIANFSQDLYYIGVTANPAVGGETVGGGYFLYGHWCILHAIPADGYTFANWTVNGEVVCTEPIYRFIVTESLDVVANFTQDGYIVVAAINPTEAGNTTGSGVYTYGQTATLTATANMGYTFINWTDENGVQVSTNTTYSFTVTGDVLYIANFSQNLYTISVEANPADAAYVFIQNGGNGQFAYGDNVTLRVANVGSGYEFVNWTLNGYEVSTNMTYTFTVTGNAHYVANFNSRTVRIYAVATRDGMGEITGAGEYLYGETVTMNAIPGEGYVFVSWTEKDELVSEQISFSFIATEDRYFEAHFAEMTGVDENKTFNVSIYPNPVSNKMMVLTDQADYQLDIFTITGAKIRTMSNCSYNTELDVQSLPAGSYIIRLTSDENVETRRFVKE